MYIRLSNRKEVEKQQFFDMARARSFGLPLHNLSIVHFESQQLCYIMAKRIEHLMLLSDEIRWWPKVLEPWNVVIRRICIDFDV